MAFFERFSTQEYLYAGLEKDYVANFEAGPLHLAYGRLLYIYSRWKSQPPNELSLSATLFSGK